ncbi:expressed unknown protein [Ectocarpus siliculosus]|uniref:Uncharacterized protein n=1 Tax=Ectocarpus siliculosus TaxID=2880 RepID=D7G3T6_ECTSI|nr:expressed unknown protein [Ectocarpus siliculosus]|eukprot:CBJ33613.1 expressed unknown protein [Ectocarpus siliculosus]
MTGPAPTPEPTPAPTPPPTDEVPMCDGGIVGIQQSDICCSSSCGSCGGTGCTSRDGGSEACCGGGVRASGRFCSVTGEAPCMTGPAPTPEPTPAPTPPPTDEVPMCDGGIVGIQQSDICCSSRCGSCGGTGCTSRDGGSEACCGGGVRASGRYCSVTGEAPCMTNEVPMCDGGIVGIQQSDVCCSLSCGSCGGTGCTSRDGGSEACCGGGVRASGRDCSVTGEAPCVVTGPAFTPEPTVPTPPPTDEGPALTPEPTPAPTLPPSDEGATPVPSSASTPTPMIAPVSDDTVCTMELTEATTVPTILGGSSLTVTSSLCEFDPSAIFEIFAVGEDDLLEAVAGTVIDAATAQFTLPSLPTDTTTRSLGCTRQEFQSWTGVLSANRAGTRTHGRKLPGVTVVASSTTGKIIVGNIMLYDLVSLLESPLASVSDTDGAPRSSVITDPPSDLQLDWDASSISADSVEIVLALIMEDTGSFEDVAVLVEVPNTGSYLIPSTSLDEFDLDGSDVFFKIVGSTASLTRRLQDSGIDPIVFPEMVTTGQLEWIEDLDGNESSTTLCGTAFADDYSRFT